MGAYLDGVHRNPRPESGMHGLDHLVGDQAVGDIRLVGDHDHEKSRIVELRHGSLYAR